MFMYNWFEKQFAKHRRKMKTGEGGFTLVELVVVIAILGILGGTGTVGYRGYVKKAREAADQELIGIVNTSFASACLQHKVKITDVSEASIYLSDNKVYGLSEFSASNSEGVTIDMISDTFDMLYAGNSDSQFKTEGIESLEWSVADSSFKLSTNPVPARVRLNNGNIITVTAEQLQNLADSGLVEMGYDGFCTIMDRVGDSSSTLVSALGLSESYFSRLSNAMVRNGLMSATEASEISKALRGEESIYTYAEAQKRASNAMALCAAMEISDPNTDVEDLMNVDFGSNVFDIMDAYTDNGGTKATAALSMQYAVTSAYASQNPNAKVTVARVYSMTVNDLLNGSFSGAKGLAVSSVRNDPAKLMSTIQGATANNGSISYNEYVSNGQYDKDVDGMSTALGVLGGNVKKENVDATINVTGEGGFLDKGMESTDTEDLINKVLTEAEKKQSAE